MWVLEKTAGGLGERRGDCPGERRVGGCPGERRGDSAADAEEEPVRRRSWEGR